MLLSLVASAGVIFLGVLEGIVVAVVLSILLFFHRNWWPHGEVLGRVPGREGWHSDQGGDGFAEHPDVVVFRWEAPLFFANSGIFADQVRDLVQERRPAWVVLQCEAITDIDVTAAGMLERLDNELNAKGVHLAFVELRTRLRDLVHDYGLFKTLDRDHFYASIDEALRDIDPTLGDDERHGRRLAGRQLTLRLVDRRGPSGDGPEQRPQRPPLRRWHQRRR